nr:unnamed protein product [Digitaria exilis]
MVHGTLEVLLVGAKGLENTDYLCNMDPYAILKCRSQEQKSSIATDQKKNHAIVLTLESRVHSFSKVLSNTNLRSSKNTSNCKMIMHIGKGADPEWNENFVFTVSDQTADLLIKLMDSDAGTADDFVGEATIPLEAVYTERSIPPTIYNVVKGEKYCGEIKVGLTFTPEVVSENLPVFLY